MTRSITRTLEYAYDDFAVAQIARGLNYTEDAERYEERAGYWRNLFRGDVRSVVGGRDSGFEGFLQPRFLNGSWGYQVRSYHPGIKTRANNTRTLLPAPVSTQAARHAHFKTTAPKPLKTASGNTNCTSLPLPFLLP